MVSRPRVSDLVNKKNQQVYYRYFGGYAEPGRQIGSACGWITATFLSF